ncbi:MAG: UDP-N-acetylmuramoyl-L-alanine--D-glutamate ligase [Maricaulaceae bacterium]
MWAVPDVAGRTYAVFGLGRSGLAAAKALKAGRARVLAWDDRVEAQTAARDQDLPVVDLNRRDWGDVEALVLSPGVPWSLPKPHRIAQIAQAVGVPITNDVELFARSVAALPANRKPRLVGITGTNGKSTTTALMTHVLCEAGRRAIAGGNIGRAVFDLDPPHRGTVYVLELSSFQLEHVKTLGCDVRLWLNLGEDHLDRHGDMAGYRAAKEGLFNAPGETTRYVIGVDDADSRAVFAKLRGAYGGRVVPVSGARALGEGVYALDGALVDATEGRARPLTDLKKSRALHGDHNGQNAAAAYAGCRAMGLTAEDIVAGLLSFPGLPHRLREVARAGEVRFIDDSKATNPDAAARALSVYPRIYWIAGGRVKSRGLGPVLDRLGGVVRAYLFGECAAHFAAELEGRVAVARLDTLADAVRAAAAQALTEDCASVVLLAPAAASFDQFSDFEARGRAFAEAVRGVLAERAL